MSEFVFLTTSDVHISDNGPSGRIDDFKETILNKLSKEGREAIIKLEARLAEIQPEKEAIDNMLRQLEKHEAFIE